MISSPQEDALPTLEEAKEALECLIENEEDDPWREVVLSCLDYGTRYKAVCFHRETANGNGKNEEDLKVADDGTGDVKMDTSTDTPATEAEKDTKPPIATIDIPPDPKKTQESVKLLSQIIHQYDKRQKSNLNDNGHLSIDCQARSVIVDAFWLIGFLLDPTSAEKSSSNATSTKNSSTPTTKINTKPNHQALVEIIDSMTITSTTTTSPTNVIPAPLIATTLEPQLLQAISTHATQKKQTPLFHNFSLKSDPTGFRTFFNKLKRKNTDMFYRQQKVNLLQEESEGYAKLVVYLLSLSDERENLLEIEGQENGVSEKGNVPSTPSKTPSTPTERTNDTTDTESSNPILNTIKEQIGAFDLDPNRVLDLTLDVLEWNVSVLLKSNKTTATNNHFNSTDYYSIFTKQHTNETNSTNGSNDRVVQTIKILLEILRMFKLESIAHLIGFKFASYATPKSESFVIPEKTSDTKTDNTTKAETPPGTKTFSCT